MPGVAEVFNRAQRRKAADWFTGTVTAVGAGRQLTVALHPGGELTGAITVAAGIAVNNRVLIVATGEGVFVLGAIG